MSNVTWQLVVDPAVHKALRKFPRQDQQALVSEDLQERIFFTLERREAVLFE